MSLSRTLLFATLLFSSTVVHAQNTNHQCAEGDLTAERVGLDERHPSSRVKGETAAIPIPSRL